jgi:hypothetical protein
MTGTNCFVVTAFVLALAGVRPASADSITAIFNIANPTFPPPGSAPWGTLDLSLDAGGSIDGSLVMSPGLVTQGMCFNVVGSGAGFAVTGLPQGWASHTAPDACVTNLGVFNAVMDTAGGGEQSSLAFTVSRTGGFSSVTELVLLSHDPFPPLSPVHFWLAVGQAGVPFASGGGIAASIVPEAGTFALFGLGLIGVGGIVRRKVH